MRSDRMRSTGNGTTGARISYQWTELKRAAPRSSALRFWAKPTLIPCLATTLKTPRRQQAEASNASLIHDGGSRFLFHLGSGHLRTSLRNEILQVFSS